MNRYTDDIRILKITQRGSATSIEYDLKPWPFVPNESIANEVMFKVICALRRGQQIPHKLEFVGQGHFKSDVGRKFRSPSVETHISAHNANRIICSGNSDADINWRRLRTHETPPLTSYLDGPQVYDSTAALASFLREFKGGHLRVGPVFPPGGLASLPTVPPCNT